MSSTIFKSLVAGVAAGAAACFAWRSMARLPSESSCRLEPARPGLDLPARLARLDHDLRTPIGTIANAVELLRSSGHDPAVESEAFEVIDRQIGRLTTLAAELCELSASFGAGMPSRVSGPEHRKKLP